MKRDVEQLRVLVDLYKVCQKNRIAMTNRVGAIDRGDDDAGEDVRAMYARWGRRFGVMEDDSEMLIYEIVDDYPIVAAMTAVKGIGDLLAAQLAGLIVDIGRYDTVSKLWRYCGLAVIDGKAERKTKGELMHYNGRLKALLQGVIAGSFLRANSPYRAVYDRAREKYDAERPDWVKLRRHRAALRKMTKLFLAHLWQVWREMEGLPTREPYIVGREGHTTYIPPEEYGWGELPVP